MYSLSRMETIVILCIFFACMTCIRLINVYSYLYDCVATHGRTYQNARVEPIEAALETDLPVVSTAIGVIVTEAYVV